MCTTREAGAAILGREEGPHLQVPVALQFPRPLQMVPLRLTLPSLWDGVHAAQGRDKSIFQGWPIRWVEKIRVLYDVLYVLYDVLYCEPAFGPTVMAR
eukprot:4081273-Pyramimonas_sp.AAC.1